MGVQKKIQAWLHNHKVYLGHWLWRNKDCWRSRLLIILIASESCLYDKGGWGWDYMTWKFTAEQSETQALLKACKIYGVDFKQFDELRKKLGMMPWRNHRW